MIDWRWYFALEMIPELSRMYIHEFHLFNTLPSDVPIDQRSTFVFFIEIIQQFITLVDHPFHSISKEHHSIEIKKEKTEHCFELQ